MKFGQFPYRKTCAQRSVYEPDNNLPECSNIIVIKPQK